MASHAARSAARRRPRRRSAPASAPCATPWASRCATWPSAPASARRCCPRSSAGRPARPWPSPPKIAAGLELTLSQLLRLDEGQHVVDQPRRRAPPLRARRPPLRGADAAAARPARRRLPARAGAGRHHRRPRRPADARAGQPRDRGRPRRRLWPWSSKAAATSCEPATASPSTPTFPTTSRTRARSRPRFLAVIAAGLRRS